MAKKQTFSDELRRVIENSELSRYAISKKTGIAQSSLSQFMHGKRMISLRNVDAIFECLDLEIKVQKRTSKGRKTNGKRR